MRTALLSPPKRATERVSNKTRQDFTRCEAAWCVARRLGPAIPANNARAMQASGTAEARRLVVTLAIAHIARTRAGEPIRANRPAAVDTLVAEILGPSSGTSRDSNIPRRCSASEQGIAIVRSAAKGTSAVGPGNRTVPIRKIIWRAEASRPPRRVRPRTPPPQNTSPRSDPRKIR